MLCRLTDLDTGQRVCSNSSGMVWQHFHPRDSDGSSLKMSVNAVKNPNKFVLLKATITWSSHVKANQRLLVPFIYRRHKKREEQIPRQAQLQSVARPTSNFSLLKCNS
jgi:hypothetical protein